MACGRTETASGVYRLMDRTNVRPGTAVPSTKSFTEDSIGYGGDHPVAEGRFELPTLRLSTTRSDQLSYPAAGGLHLMP